MDVGGLVYGYTVFIVPCCCTCDGRIFGGGYGRNDCEKNTIFGVFQFLMPCIGNLVSGFATDIVERFDHWIAFVLLGFLGLHMIWESRTEQEIPKNPLKNSSLLLAAIATSIDALAAGVTLAAVGTPILFSSTVIGITAFLFSFGGVFIGKKFGGFLGSKAECIGGIILILIGVKTLVEHLY